MRVLLVEDDPSLSSSLCRALEAQKFAVTAVGDGDNGLTELCGNDYQLAILDVLLPKRDGLSVCAEARRQGIVTPILMLTARNAVTDRVTGLNSGADDYLPKPFAFPELLARIHALLRRPHSELRPRTVTVGKLAIDVLRHQTTFEGRVLRLTKTEYRLLLYLMENAGIVLTKDALLDRLWGGEHGGNSNILEVYVKMLRRKLADAGDNAVIRTVRGAGYTIDKT
ncbi:MAG: DNA-binding response regulator [Candidatus Eremiobacter antarcticus]|nr:response regulator transcription factor [Candidatus Eremiobacteraeota bacterium]MBC5807529.1 response regulator transcription factor [Candidatus Eremiobacteraeota bacterium]PZR61418.1 MAG: DNA-binding response regulator [Candidatus Eremiobacter sp. RRmetagenome_bin22]